jgi:type VI secretion system protein ImpJ
MIFNRDIRWRQGSFLEPQHFQMMDLRRRLELSFLSGALFPHAWGLANLQINETALLGGFLEVQKLDLWLADGRRLIFPDNLVILGGSFREAWKPAAETLQVGLFAPHFYLAGANAQDPRPFSSLGESPAPAETSREKLYQCQEEPDLAPDLYGSGPPGRVETLLFQARLVFGPPKADWPGQVIPLARLRREGDQARLDPTYAPPALVLYPGHPAKTLLGEALTLLLARLSQLEEFRLDPALSRRPDPGGPGPALVALLGVLGRHLPRLSILESSPTLHPFTVYAALAELAGELAIFAPREADPANSLFLPPPYDHLDCLAALNSLRTVIARLLEALSLGPTVSLPFRREGERFELDLPPEGLGQEPYSLAIRTNLESPELNSRLSWRARLGPPERVALLATHSLPGIGLAPLKSPPFGLPSRPGLGYYLIRHSDPLWAESLQAGRLTLLWPEAPAETTVRLVAGRA